MRKLKFIEGGLPAEVKLDFDPSLFNGQIHRRLQAGQNWESFHLVDADRKKNLASIHFHVDQATAQSPWRAPFGSVDFSEALPSEELFIFFQEVENALRRRGVKWVRIKNPPAAYRSKVSVIPEVLLLNLGYRVEQAEINASLEVGNVSLEKKLASWELRKLKQSRKAKLAFRKIPLSRLDDAYNFILGCRRERQQELSMTLDELRHAVTACPKNFFLFGVYQASELAAACVIVRVTRKIAYVFYTAHSRRFDFLSPVVLQTVEVYAWCQEQGITLLDLGTSALAGKPNFGLLDFKLHLGGMPSGKLTLVKELT